MKKLVLKIEAVEDRTAPIMFTERNLPGSCCCTCCCCCCGSQEAQEIHNSLEMSLVSITNAAAGGPSVINFTPYKEAGMYDFIAGLDYGYDYTITFNRQWDAIFDDYMNKEY